METLSLLDVGHGNCSILRDGGRAIVIDASSKSTLAAGLDALEIDEIEALIVSHGDEDHVSGAASLLANKDRPVRNLYANPDVLRGTKAWRAFLVATSEAAKNGTRVHSALTDVHPGELRLGRSSITVLFPFGDLGLVGVEGRGMENERLDANTMSGVIRVSYDDAAFCLIAGDMSQTSLDLMMERNQEIRAPVLIFPHHGGLPRRANGEVFARMVTQSVSPELVIFSLGRGAHSNPRPEIIRGVKQAMNGASPYLACTQLSRRCAASIPDARPPVVEYSAGYKQNASCAGTLTLTLSHPVKDEVEKLRGSHGAFIVEHVPGRICGLG